MKPKLTKVILSLFIVFHLTAIVLFPNPGSVLSRYFDPLFNAYGNQLGLNTTWQFFSPNPGGMRFINYDVIVESDSDIDVVSFQLPPQEASDISRLAYGRLFYFTVRMVATPLSIENFLIPYLCRKHPQATSIAIKTIEKQIVSMAKARNQGSENFDDLRQQPNLPEQEFGCDREVLDE